MITVIAPTLNEERHIGHLLDQVLADAEPELAEVIVADGGSTDATCSIVEARARRDRRVRLLHNPDRLQSAAMNLAVAQADPRSGVIVRLDAHAEYPAGFVSSAARILQEMGADSVVVRLATRGGGCFQKAVAAASNSRLGSGGSVHRVGGASRWIDHGHHAAFTRASFVRQGGYDPDFRANEDGDYDVRLRRAGGRIWFSSELEIGYIPRATPTALARQYFRNGVGRAQNFKKNGEALKPRQLAPVAILAGVSGGIALAPFSRGASLLAPIVYFAACGFTGVAMAARERDACVLGASAALPLMHLSWATGFLVQLVRKTKVAMITRQPARQGS